MLTGGRGSGKTFVVMDYQGRCLLQKDDRCLYTRYTMTSAEKSIIPEFKQRIEEIGISSICNITSDTVTNLRNGSFVFFSGLKPSSNTQKANLKSLPDINRWIIEEGEDFNDFERFNKIDDSIRTTKAHNEVLWLQNPSNYEHFIWQTYFENSHRIINVDGFDVQICTHPDIEHIHTTYLDNLKNLDKSFLAKAYEWREKAKKGDEQAIAFYTNNYLGAWIDRPQGTVFRDWIIGDFDESLQYVYGLDFGFEPDPCALVKVAIDNANKKIYIKELLYQVGLRTAQLGTLLRMQTNMDAKPIVADRQEKRLIIELINEYKLNVIPCNKYAGSVEDGIRVMQDYQLVIEPNSFNIIKELKNYVYLNKSGNVFIDAYNHAIDAARYGVQFLKTSY